VHARNAAIVREANGASDIAEVRVLVEEYATSLGIDGK
jgi:hypothetical protein